MNEILELNIYCDGASRGNPGLGGAGGLLVDQKGQTILEISEFLGELTNNQAEYKALLISLEKAKAYQPSRISVYTDSELLSKQVNGEYKVKNSSLKELFRQVMSILSSFPGYDIYYISRDDNTRADELANDAIDLYLQGKKSKYIFSNSQEQINLFE